MQYWVWMVMRAGRVEEERMTRAAISTGWYQPLSDRSPDTSNPATHPTPFKMAKCRYRPELIRKMLVKNYKMLVLTDKN